MSLEHLIIKPASEAQTREAYLRHAAHWGTKAGISTDDFMKLHAALEQGMYARDGRLKHWVLVHQDNPESTDFYASCQVMTRSVLALHPGQSFPRSSFGHAITFVIVPQEYRGKGYANHFMSLLHSALAPHRYPNLTKAPTVTDPPSTASILYSAVGDYYAQCVPSVGESGWSLQSSFITTWPLSNVVIPSGTESLPPAQLLSEFDVIATLDSDDLNVPADLLRLQEKNPTKTYFAFVPTAPLNAYSLTMSKMTPRGTTNASWGARIPGTSDFMTWVLFGASGRKLMVTRLRATTDMFPVLLDAAVRVAQEAQCESIEIWNVPEHLKGVSHKTGGIIVEQKECLPAFKWYGLQPEETGADVVWALEERYSWC